MGYGNRFQRRRPGRALLLAAAALAWLGLRGSVVGQSRAAEAGPAPALQLRLFDDFAEAKVSEGKWTPQVAGTGTAVFERGRVVMDMTAGSAAQASPINLVHLYAKTVVRLAEADDAVRITWDMQLLKDRPHAFGFGPCVGDAAGKHVVVGQFGRKSGAGVPHDVFVPGVPGDGVDHGIEMLHYDLTVTLQDAHTGAVRVDLAVYAHCAEFDATPELYTTKAKAMAVLAGHGAVAVGREVPLYFCLERDDAAGDPYVQQARGRVAVSRVFIGETPAEEAPTDTPY